jgi:hypothetical protein
LYTAIIFFFASISFMGTAVHTGGIRCGYGTLLIWLYGEGLWATLSVVSEESDNGVEGTKPSTYGGDH